MNKTNIKTGITLKGFGTILSIGAIALLISVSGCAGDRYNQSTGQRIDDNRTTERVSEALAHDPQYKYDGGKVVAFKGVVQLNGFVNTKAQKDSAGATAKKTEGVGEVVNNITVKE